MTPDEDQLRRALEARSGAPSPEFRARLSEALQTRPAAPNLMPAVAFATVVVLTLTSVGVLLAARHFGRPSGLAASGARVVSPSPGSMPVAAAGNLQISAPSTNVVWAVVDYAHLYRSTDEGNQWEERSVPSQFGVRPSISFIDDHEGWLLAPGVPASQCEAAGAAIWHTADGGATWQQLDAQGIAENQCKESIWFVDRNTGFVSAWDDNNPPTIYFTGDGGRTWKKSRLPDPPDFKSAPGGFTLRAAWLKRFGFTLYLLAYGKQGEGSPYPDVPDRQYIFVSTDGGGTWKWKEKTTSRSIVMVTETRWLDLSVPGRSSATADGGQSFGPYASDFNSDAPDNTQFVFAGPLVGYASGNGMLQRTSDGGAHWARIQAPGARPSASPSTAPAASPIPMPTTTVLSAPSTSVVWALVANRYLFRSIDQGGTWEQRNWAPYPGGGGDPLISFVDGTNGWAMFPGVPGTQCSQEGVQVWRTTDGANTWQLVAVAQYGQVSPNGLAFEQCKESIHFEDASHGFIGADDPTGDTVWQTSDGGVTWSAGRLPMPPGFTPGGGRVPITSIKAFGSTVLAYAQPYVFESKDGGGTWVAMTLASVLPDLAFVTPTRWLLLTVAPDPSTETTDGGSTWHQFTSDYTQAAGVAPVVVFADANVGYATVRGGIQQTKDGGAHWSNIKTPGT